MCATWTTSYSGVSTRPHCLACVTGLRTGWGMNLGLPSRNGPTSTGPRMEWISLACASTRMKFASTVRARYGIDVRSERARWPFRAVTLRKRRCRLASRHSRPSRNRLVPGCGGKRFGLTARSDGVEPCLPRRQLEQQRAELPLREPQQEPAVQPQQQPGLPPLLLRSTAGDEPRGPRSRPVSGNGTNENRGLAPVAPSNVPVRTS